jgi:hypothetical protein
VLFAAPVELAADVLAERADQLLADDGWPAALLDAVELSVRRRRIAGIRRRKG